MKWVNFQLPTSNLQLPTPKARLQENWALGIGSWELIRES